MTARGMSGERWRELRHVKPLDRTRLPMPASARRRPGEAPHTRQGPHRDTVGLARQRRHRRHPDGTWRWVFDPSPDAKVWHTTQPRPWTLRARRRARGRAARASRKANR